MKVSVQLAGSAQERFLCNINNKIILIINTCTHKLKSYDCIGRICANSRFISIMYRWSRCSNDASNIFLWFRHYTDEKFALCVVSRKILFENVACG